MQFEMLSQAANTASRHVGFALPQSRLLRGRIITITSLETSWDELMPQLYHCHAKFAPYMDRPPLQGDKRGRQERWSCGHIYGFVGKDVAFPALRESARARLYRSETSAGHGAKQALRTRG
jgi:hypothetical protein